MDTSHNSNLNIDSSCYGGLAYFASTTLVGPSLLAFGFKICPFYIFRRAGVSMKKETPVNFLSNPLDKRLTLRHADVMVYRWVGAKHARMDLTRVSPLVRLGVGAFTVGQVALKVASNKVAKHE